MSTNTADLEWLSMLALLGAALGVLLFFRGFRMLQYKRLILNTPFSKIRSASIGLAEVSGTPTGPKTISSAITGSPCFYYRARGWQWVTSERGSGSWKQVVDESVFVPFFLDDGTGNVLVNPQGATLDVHRSFYDDFPLMSVVGKSSIVPESIRKFVATRGLMGGEKVRLEEHIIKPGYPLFVFGTLGENSAVNSWNPQTHFGGKKITISLGDLASFGFGSGSSAADGAVGALAGLLDRASSVESRTVTYTLQSDRGTDALQKEVLDKLSRGEITLPAAAQDVFTKAMLSGSARGIVTQVVPPPGIANNAADTPAGVATAGGEKNSASKEGQEAFDLHSHVALSKGERGDPFTISSRSQREVVQSLGWKAVTCIWGGPVFALLCLYCLMVCWGWI